jgi:glucose dehydrogenase
MGIRAHKGTPYVMRRKPLLSTAGLPCSPPLWGTLTAVDVIGATREGTFRAFDTATGRELRTPA